ncbi:MAG: hypothetical protein JSR65_03755 [Proteobacteria bacterium]|nr:hypothetical protein [Pseudomonadota bacterium]
MSDYIQAWQCIGCGKIEAPQTCIGVCRDRKVYFVGKDEHDAALAEILRLHARLDQAAESLLRFEHAKPHPKQWQRAYEALRDQARAVRAMLQAD